MATGINSPEIIVIYITAFESTTDHVKDNDTISKIITLFKKLHLFCLSWNWLANTEY